MKVLGILGPGGFSLSSLSRLGPCLYWPPKYAQEKEGIRRPQRLKCALHIELRSAINLVCFCWFLFFFFNGGCKDEHAVRFQSS